MTNPPKERGTRWERIVADYAASKGLPWDRAPLRGTADLLDMSGVIPDGWLVGCKAISRQGNIADRLSTGMNEAQAALERLRAITPADDVVAVQIFQRTGKPVGRAYVVMEFDPFIDLVKQRRAWREAVNGR